MRIVLTKSIYIPLFLPLAQIQLQPAGTAVTIFFDCIKCIVYTFLGFFFQIYLRLSSHRFISCLVRKRKQNILCNLFESPKYSPGVGDALVRLMQCKIMMRRMLRKQCIRQQQTIPVLQTNFIYHNKEINLLSNTICKLNGEVYGFTENINIKKILKISACNAVK